MTESVVLQMEGIRKVFGTVVALDDVNLHLKSNEIHGLLGGNGAGKTTLMNVLFGLYKPNAGEVRLHGKKVSIRSPKDAINHKIGMVHQHFLQVDNYTVTENIVLGMDLKSWPTLRLDEQADQIRALSEKFGLAVDPDKVISELPIGVRQKVEILKALYRGVEVLILDEPTTNLTPQEVDDLFESLRVMVNEGLSIVFITHKLREVLSVCDRITVLRDGKNVLTQEREDVSEKSMVKAMVGEGLDVDKSVVFSSVEKDTQSAWDVSAFGEPVVRVKDLSAQSEEGLPVLQGCSFDVREKEIFGIAGVAGNGQQILAECLMGVFPIQKGSVSIADMDVTETETKDLLAGGVAYIPQDRLQDGYLPTASVAHNLILGHQNNPAYNKKGFLDWKTIFKSAGEQIEEYTIMTPSAADVGANLSGGNIQRVMLARAFAHPSQFLIAHNPTRGLDIRSMDFVYNKIFERQAMGSAVLLISEDLDELFRICDRIATIYRGEIVGILEKGTFDKYEIGRMMSGVKAND
jgi:general nucleoside transport system ATP-binding protein